MIVWWLVLLIVWLASSVAFVAGAWWGTVQAGEKHTDAEYSARYQRNSAVEDAAEMAITGDDW